MGIVHSVRSSSGRDCPGAHDKHGAAKGYREWNRDTSCVGGEPEAEDRMSYSLNVSTGWSARSSANTPAESTPARTDPHTRFTVNLNA